MNTVHTTCKVQYHEYSIIKLFDSFINETCNSHNVLAQVCHNKYIFLGYCTCSN